MGTLYSLLMLSQSIPPIIVVVTVIAVAAVTIAISMPWLYNNTDDGDKKEPVLPLKDGEEVRISVLEPEDDTPLDPELEKIRYLTEEEERKVIDIAVNDPAVKSILDKADGWKILHVGAWSEGGRKVGGTLDIILDNTVWVEGEFKTHWGIDRVSTWSKSLMISVDLSKESVVSLVVRPGMPPQEMPEGKEDEYSKARDVARARALQEQDLKDKDLKVSFVWFIDTDKIKGEQPEGIAVFLVRSEHGDEMMVAVDMKSMQVVEKYTAKTLR